ncbi:MAG: hypothetical protein Q9O74_11925 [Planctomycetota bacterium]|nr:hypothetical protein [Planctomycetota bacterium]
MTERPSLIDESDTPAPATKNSKGSGGGLNANTVKAIAAGAALLLAGVVLAWGMGAFRSGPEVPDDHAQQRERLEQEVQEDAKIDAKSPVINYESGG